MRGIRLSWQYVRNVSRMAISSSVSSPFTHSGSSQSYTAVRDTNGKGYYHILVQGCEH